MNHIFYVLACLIVIVNGQGLWDYNDYNSVLFPPFQQRPIPQQFPFKQAHSVSRIHHLGSASYRPPANELKFGDTTGPYYTGKGNDFIGSSAERAALANTNHGDLDSLLARIVTKLPSIADQLSHMISTTTPQTPAINPNFWMPFVHPDSDSQNNQELFGTQNVKRSPPSSVINSMPDPSAFFSIGKLINAFTGSGLDGPKFEKQIDVESVKGVPILKDEDQEPEIVKKSEDEELPHSQSSESNESTGTPELVILTLPQNVEEETTTSEPIKTDEGDNLLGSLLNGKLDRVDWLGSIFGGNKKSSDKHEEEGGNALAQLFSGSHLFGSAIQQHDNDNQKVKKFEDRNFH